LEFQFVDGARFVGEGRHSGEKFVGGTPTTAESLVAADSQNQPN